MGSHMRSNSSHIVARVVAPMVVVALIATGSLFIGDRNTTNLALPRPSTVAAATPAVNVTTSKAVLGEAADLDAGRRLYDVNCWFCHGAKGHGDGPVAKFLKVKPRDFTKAEYKIRSTPYGTLPTDADIFRTITRGVPGTRMPSWASLSEQERWQLTAFVKSLSDRFSTEPKPQPLKVTAFDAGDPLAVERGRKLYESAKCWLCHGKQGKGDGPITTALVRQWGLPYEARNLRDGASYKAGSTAADIYRTITTGFNGTPMGAHDDLLSDQERRDVAQYVATFADKNIPLSAPVTAAVSWQRGRWVFFGKGRCIVCHKVEAIGDGQRGPDLTEIGIVAATRRPGQSAAEYLLESIVKPEAFLVPEYGEHMPKVNREGIFLEPDEIRSLVVYLSSQGKDAGPDVDQLARLAEPTIPPAGASVLVDSKGDPNHGWEVYRSEKATCFKCHSLHGSGGTIGPDITNLSTFQSLRQVKESIEQPNKVIVHGYNEVSIVTQRGFEFVGVVVHEDATEIHLSDAQGKVQVVLKSDIDEITPLKASNMPSGFVQQITPAEYENLVAFLFDQQPALQDSLHVARTSPFANPLKRTKNGPPLRNVTHKVGRTWLENWLKNPKGHDPNTFMPNLELGDDEISAVIAYLSAIADEDFPQHKWEPLLVKSFDDLSDAEFDALDELVAKGKTIWSESRCSICHRVGDRGGVVGHAPALTNAGGKLKRDWIYYWLEDPRYYFSGTQMPSFRFTAEQRKNLLAYLLKGDNFGGFDVEVAPDDQPSFEKPDADLVRRGAEVIQRNRCVICHDIPGIPETLAEKTTWPEPRNDFELLVRDARCLTCHAIRGNGGTFAPELTTVGSRLRRDWLEQFLMAPDIIRPMLKQMPKLQLTQAEARVAADYAKKHLTDPSIDSDFLSKNPSTPEDVERGKQLYDAKGCAACHQIGDSGGAIGPTLTHVADRLEPGYIYQYVKNPQRFNARVVEPNYGFTNRQALDLTKYLLTLKKQVRGGR